MQTNQLKIPAMELIFSTKLQAEGLQLYQKYALLQVFSKGFAQIFSYLKKISISQKSFQLTQTTI